MKRWVLRREGTDDGDSVWFGVDPKSPFSNRQGNRFVCYAEFHRWTGISLRADEMIQITVGKRKKVKP